MTCVVPAGNDSPHPLVSLSLTRSPTPSLSDWCTCTYVFITGTVYWKVSFSQDVCDLSYLCKNNSSPDRLPPPPTPPPFLSSFLTVLFVKYVLVGTRLVVCIL